MADVGEEFGATTGRRRQTNWMNMQNLERAIFINGVTHVVFNKVDVLKEIGAWALYDKEKKVSFKNEKDMQGFIVKRLKTLGIPKSRIYFSASKERI